MPDNRLSEFVDLLASNIPNWHEQANMTYCRNRIREQSQSLFRELYADIMKANAFGEMILIEDLNSAFERFGVKIGE